MAEDDEVDVLGDCGFDLLNKNDSLDGTPLVCQNSDLLNCDYTIHPQWLLDKPSTNPALWYDTRDLDVADYDPQNEALPQQNSINDESGWTEKEKDLLNRGIEIFGKSNLNLSQFIGSRTPAEVKYFLKNFYSDVHLSNTSVNEDILFDNSVEETVVTASNVLQEYEIPASTEEVIDSVSTGKTTIVQKLKHLSKATSIHSSNGINYKNVSCGQSLLKLNYGNHKKKPISRRNNLAKIKENSRKVKFKTKLQMGIKRNEELVTSKKICNPKNILNKLSNKKLFESELNQSTTKVQSHVSKKETINIIYENTIEVKKDLRIVTGKGLSVPVCDGEEVIKIIKDDNTESDSDVDIEDDDDKISTTLNSMEVESSVTMHKSIINKPPAIQPSGSANEKDCIDEKIETNCKVLPKRGPKLEDLPELIVKELLSLEEPSSEVFISRENISDVEKFIFYEFFENRSTKTPERYLHIRNHILDAWKYAKPKYVRKTSIRTGLKQGGDVNLVGRIHSYLEQIGAINFGCEHTIYSRPLLDLATVAITKEKSILIKTESLPRQRIKKKYINDGEGGYTLTHDEKGEIINTTVVNEEPTVKQRIYLKKQSIRLVYCRPFTEEYPQKYSISLDLPTLIIMDLHAHMHHTEVMGLIGGCWSSTLNKLTINRYIPCRNIASSLTHCDMCPISQAKAADTLHNENLDILGWYHSHPTFAPEPSHQDIETQLNVQQWMGYRVPCIGFILSPFSLNGALIASPYRCMLVKEISNSPCQQSSIADIKEETEKNPLVPYKFNVDLCEEDLVVSELLERAKQVIEEDCTDIEKGIKSRVDFGKPYFQDNSITYLDKFIYSVQMHLAKCSGINKMTCDATITGLKKICMHYSALFKK